MIGHIKLERKVLNWEWYTDHKTFHVFLYLLLKANHKEGKWRGVIVDRGQFIFGRLKASADTGLTENEVRGCINKLKNTKEISLKTTNRFTIITICKYDHYQSIEKKVNQQITSKTTNNSPAKKPTNHQQFTTNKNDKNEEEDNNVFNTMPLPENFNGLPQRIKDSAHEQLVIFQGVRLSDEEFSALWEAFKKQVLTGKDFYANEEKVYKYFINWAKIQKFQKHGKEQSKSNASNIGGSFKFDNP